MGMVMRGIVTDSWGQGMCSHGGLHYALLPQTSQDPPASAYQRVFRG